MRARLRVQEVRVVLDVLAEVFFSLYENLFQFLDRALEILAEIFVLDVVGVLYGVERVGDVWQLLDLGEKREDE